jgi:outer membrane protein assembly factor BamB
MGSTAIAVPQLLYPEPIPSSAFFLKKKAPFAESHRASELWNRSSFLRRSMQALALVSIAAGSVAAQTLQATPDFSLESSETSLTLAAGGPAHSIAISARALNGFSGAVRVSIGGLPEGVTASPESFVLTAGTAEKVSIEAAKTATLGGTIEFKGTSGSQSHSAAVLLKADRLFFISPVDSPTFRYDVGRTGLNSRETILTHANVNEKEFGLLSIWSLDGHVDGQPLYLSRFLAAGKVRDVVYAVTENDSVYAFDAGSGAQLWRTSLLGLKETTSGDHDCSQITPAIGITSTPVIDRHLGPHGTMFVVGMSEDEEGNYHQRLHALDAATGAEMPGSPAEIHATYPGKGINSAAGVETFEPANYAERAGLLLLNGVVYLGWTSHCDYLPYQGWLMGYNEDTLEQTSVLNLTPNGNEGAIWMAGGGIAADEFGNIYVLDANGTFDTTLNSKGFPSQGDFGNAFLKISTTRRKLAVADYFEMYNTVTLSTDDIDLGSGGVLVLPEVKDDAGQVHHLAVGAGKDSKIYVVNRDSMGKFNPKNNNAIYQEVDGQIGGVWSSPAYFNNTVYYAAVDDNLKAFRIANGKLSKAPVAQSSNSFGYPGATPAISAIGTRNGIVWAVENATPAVLHAYNASTLEEIYNSTQAPNDRDNFGPGNKFIAPLVINGKVYVGTTTGVAVFGLLPK